GLGQIELLLQLLSHWLELAGHEGDLPETRGDGHLREASHRMVDCDVVVVGAGAMGSATAWWLARWGADVVLLEQFEAGHHRGSSHGSTRIFRLAYPEPVHVEMARQALPLWRDLEDDAGREL